MHGHVVVGRFGSPYGVKGWIKVISFTDPIEKILAYRPWCIVKQNTPILLEIVNGRLHGEGIVVQLGGCEDREKAKTFTNLDIFIQRATLPKLASEEYYWIELIGLTVINQEQENLGIVESLFPTGSNDVLVVKDTSGKERYIPYTAAVILNVNLEDKQLLVNWDAAF